VSDVGNASVVCVLCVSLVARVRNDQDEKD
jgi:hypothetical protein